MDRTTGVIVLAAFIYLMWPAPETPKLSKRLLKWQEDGRVFLFQGKYYIFFRDEQGTGHKDEVLVMLHGFPTSGFDWFKVLTSLKGRFGRVIVPDMLGFGFSDKPVNHEYSIVEQADVIEHLLRHLSIDRAHFLSHDYGNTVTQEILHRYSNSRDVVQTLAEIKTVCLLNGGVSPQLHSPLWSKEVKLPFLNSHVDIPFLSDRGIFSNKLSNIFGQNKPTPEEMDEWWALSRHNNGNYALPRLMNYIPERRVSKARWMKALDNTPAKVHYVYGPQSDPTNSIASGDHFKTINSRVTTDTLPNVGHYVHREAPEKMLDSYFKFLKQHDTP